jgi:hypothetical protein
MNNITFGAPPKTIITVEITLDGNIGFGLLIFDFRLEVQCRL